MSPSDPPPTDWLDQPGPVRRGEALDGRALAAYLQAHGLGEGGVLQIDQFPSGYSNLTYRIQGDGLELVLRRPPVGAHVKGGHDMGREYQLLSALHPTYGKVPRPILLCLDEQVLGVPFYLMERVPGVIIRRRTPRGLVLAPDQMRRLCLALVETLVDLHRVDYAAVGLGALGRPEGYVQRQVAGWTGRYAQACTDEIADMTQVGAWLAAHQPAEVAATLIHNDFRWDNVMLDPADLTQPRAVLDWEMATIGDPLMDVGTTLAYWAEPEDADVLKEFSLCGRPGVITRQEFAEHYAQVSGQDPGPLLFYYVFGLYKLAVIVQQIYARFRQGLTQDERFRSLGNVVQACARSAAAAVERGRMER